MAELKYLDLTGLTSFWEKAQAYIDEGDANAINSVTYTNENPTTAAIGGIAKGETFDNQTVKQMFDMLLYPYVAFTGATATATPTNGGTREMGNQASITAVNWNCGTKGSMDLTSVKLYSGTAASGSAIDEQTPGSAASGTFTLSDAVTTSNNNPRWTVQITDGKTTRTGTTGSFNFITAFYHGVTNKDAASITQEDILGATKDLTARGTKSYSYTTDNNKAMIAYPKSYGALTKITDGSGVTDYTAAFGSPATVSVTSTTPYAWGPIDYYVYTNGNSTATNFQYKFNF